MKTSAKNDQSSINSNNDVQLADIAIAISRIVSNEVDKSFYSNLNSIAKKVGGLLKTDLRENPIVSKNYNKAIEDVLELLRKENDRYTQEVQFRNSFQDCKVRGVNIICVGEKADEAWMKRFGQIK